MEITWDEDEEEEEEEVEDEEEAEEEAEEEEEVEDEEEEEADEEAELLVLTSISFLSLAKSTLSPIISAIRAKRSRYLPTISSVVCL